MSVLSRLAGWQRTAIVLIAIMGLLRFVRLDDVPAGFYLDEAAGAANIICLADDGKSELGETYPLFFPEFPGTGTFFTPTYVYSGAIWSKIFGTSIAAMRSHVAFYSLLAIAGVFALAHRFIGLNGALLAALSAAISPWSFHYARVAWDPPLMPAFYIWGIYFMFRRGVPSAVASGALIAAAMYSYPTARLQAPLLHLLLLVILWMERREERRADSLRFVAAQLATIFVLIAPLTWMTVTGALGQRFEALSIFNHEWLQMTEGGTSPGIIVKVFALNLARHLSPEFLFLQGDRNLRHSSGLTGQLSWLDVLALTLAAAAVAISLARRQRITMEAGRKRLLLLSAAGVLSTMAVASLTWEGIPHATRAIAAWPFFALLSGCVLSVAIAREPRASSYMIAVAMAFALFLGTTYFDSYPFLSAQSFDAAVKIEAERGRRSADWHGLEWLATLQAKPAMRYYFMHYRGLSCEGSGALLRHGAADAGSPTSGESARSLPRR